MEWLPRRWCGGTTDARTDAAGQGRLLVALAALRGERANRLLPLFF